MESEKYNYSDFFGSFNCECCSSRRLYFKGIPYIKSQFPELKQYYWGTDSLWSDGYFVSTVGVTTETIKRYITQQGEYDAGQTTTLFD